MMEEGQVNVEISEETPVVIEQPIAEQVVIEDATEIGEAEPGNIE